MTPQTNQPTPQQIASAAYLLWLQEGRPHGRDREHWQQAEQQLRAADPPPKKRRARAAAARLA